MPVNACASLRAFGFTLVGGMALAATEPASAQWGGRDDRPNRQPNMSCQNWNAQVRSGVPQVMQQLAGVWRSTHMLPAVPGVMDATPETVTTTLHGTGQLLYQKDACLQPLPVAGMPPLPRKCASAIGHGGWFAKPADGGWIFVGVWMQGSAYTGEALPPNCAGVNIRFTGPNATVNQYGVTEQRIGRAQ
jgi:hypothetical protein